MTVINTFISKTKTERLVKQAEIHRRCILLLQTFCVRCDRQ